MKALNVVTLVTVIVGAFNWGMMGLFQLDMVATLFGGPQTALSRVLYLLVGLAGLCQLIPLIGTLSSKVDEREGAASNAAYGGSDYGRAGSDRDARP